MPLDACLVINILDTDLQNMEANIGPERVVVRMLLLIWMPVKKTHSPVRLQASLLAKDQQGTRATDLQVMRQQEGDGLADK